RREDEHRGAPALRERDAQPRGGRRRRGDARDDLEGDPGRPDGLDFFTEAPEVALPNFSAEAAWSAEEKSSGLALARQAHAILRDPGVHAARHRTCAREREHRREPPEPADAAKQLG